MNLPHIGYETGKTGLGSNWYWGPNYCADLIVYTIQEKEVLCVVQYRSDNGQCVFPGGHKENNENTEQTAIREFREEMIEKVNSNNIIFNLREIYSGIVPDNRNTNNAWKYTTAYSCYIPYEEFNKIVWQKSNNEVLKIEIINIKDLENKISPVHKILYNKFIESLKNNDFSKPIKTIFLV